MKSYYLIFNTTNKLVAGPDIDQAYSKFIDLEIDDPLKESIKRRLYSKKDFEININEMVAILPAFENRIDELLNHPDFNPFKEELRKRFPEQFGSQPFEYKGTTYYLYHKGREYEIDNLIYNIISFKKLFEEHIKANQSLKYIYKE